jgi:hypothetical protein
MRISKQSSGGRGEYEISETDAASGLAPPDLFDRHITLDLGPFPIATGNWLKLAQGKRRVRLDSAAGATMHIHRQVAAALMMPAPVRDERQMSGGIPVLQTSRYIIKDIELSSVALPGAGLSRARADRIEYGNQERQAEELRVTPRMEDVERVWQRSSVLPFDLSVLIQKHEAAVRTGGPLHRGAEQTVHGIQTKLADYAEDLGVIYHPATDPLPALLSALDQINVNPPLTDSPVDLVGIEPEDVELRRREIQRWRRWARKRGAESVKFSRDVKKAYRHVCIFCGNCYPPTPISSTGIEAAHILPWAEYDLDRVDNGLALCRLHHWAFDEGLLNLEHIAGSTYRVTLPPDARDVVEAAGFSVDQLEKCVGDVPLQRLPANPKEHPNPAFLALLRSTISPLEEDAPA